MSLMILIADGDLGTNWNFWTSPGSQAREIAIVLAVLFLVVLGVFTWAAFWRKPRRRRKHAYHHHHSAPDGAPAGGLPQREKERSGLFHRKRRHRRQHRHERPVNPTLAQVGGLPPPRQNQPPDS
jgi:hypothetical protein